jgi:hypothetical protein
MQLDDEFLTALESCSNRFGRRSTQAAAEEILTLYFPHWKRAGEIALDVPHDVNGPVEEVAIS